MSTLSVCANAAGLALFAQSTLSTGWQLVRRDPLVAPEAPDASAMANVKRKSLPSSRDLDLGRLEISKAVHPHLYNKQAPIIQQESCSALSRKLKRAACGFDCDRIARTSGYTSTVPYLSTQLAFVQALLGLIVTSVTMAWQASGAQGCPAVAVVAVIHVGLALLFLASAVQTHLVNAMCIKIFAIVGLALGAHFAMLGLMVSNSLVSQDLCAVEQTQGWLANIPAYSAVAHFFVFFFSAISFINGAFRLSPKKKDFLSFREIVYVFLVYRGIGLLFIANLAGLLITTVSGVLAALRLFQIIPMWIILWSVVSRIHVLALQYRAATDRDAHLDAFWGSQEYGSEHPRLLEPLGLSDDESSIVGGLASPSPGKRGFLATGAKLLFAKAGCKKPCCSSVFRPSNHGSRRADDAQQGGGQTEATSMNNSIEQISVVMDNYATHTSRHDTVVEDDVRF
ncbi:hypothetical protein GGI23_003998 [Coemansia sp. RSA 2559]|nr:hypothetical protein GGI23_003998 [Coemansia sp. RSA 2559]